MSKSSNDPLQISILGIGNLLMQDEGIGVHIVNSLQDRYRFPSHVQLVDGGTSGIELLSVFENSEKMLIIDAANFDQPPGHIGLLKDEELLARFQSKLSLHNIGLADLLSAAKLLDVEPKEIVLVGIQPAVVDLGLELTESLQSVFDDILQTVLAILRDWKITPEPVLEPEKM